MRKPLLVLVAVAALGVALLGDPVTPSRAHQGHCAQPGPAKLTTRTLRLRRVGMFTQPTYITGAPGDRRRLFVVERGGRIWSLVHGRKRLFLDLSSETRANPQSEEGMYSMAFAPDYRRTRRFYVFFSDLGGNIRVQEFRRSRRSPARADRRSRRQVLFVDPPGEGGQLMHYGGQLQFGPDRLLYISIGDGGQWRYPPTVSPQDPGNLQGKVLRIDPRRSRGRPYSVPRRNPFVGRPGARPEVYLYGLRNPYRFSFDRRTGDLAIGDVGGSVFEEVDFLPRGLGGGWNLGWPVMEGHFRRPDDTTTRLRHYLRPVLAYPRARQLLLVVVGGYVVRDRSLRGLYGRYLYGDFCDGALRTAILRRPRATGDRALGLNVQWPTSFGQDVRGHLYVASFFGPVYRLERR